MAKSSSDRQFERWLANAETVWLTCRVNGHWWPDYQQLENEDRFGVLQGGQFLLDMMCRRDCGVRRKSYLTSSYYPEKNSNQYSYPPGYQMAESIGGGWNFDRHKRAAVRKELRRRAKQGDTA